MDLSFCFCKWLCCSKPWRVCHVACPAFMASASDGCSQAPPVKKARRSWQTHREARVAEMQAGPSSTDDLFNWPAQVIRGICKSGSAEDEEMQLRLTCNLRRSIAVYSDYSGIDCPRVALELAVQAFQAETGVTFESPPIHFCRTCDSGTVQGE